MQFPSFKNELKYLSAGYDLVLGCDEVGIGPLAGPVVAAVCVLDPNSIGKSRTKNKWYYRVRDSKTTTEEERQSLVKEILKNSTAHGVGIVWQEDIDKLNIHQASLLAMRRAVEQLLKKVPAKKKTLLFIDGRFEIPNISNNFLEQRSIVSGDRKILSIAAASIIAKVHRDNIMRELDKKFPSYGFARHKGYGTKEHKSAIKKFGIVPIHRQSFLKNSKN